MINLGDLETKMAAFKVQMDEAFTKGDMKEVANIAKLMKALDDEAHKAEREAISKEREVVAEKVEKALRKLVEKFRDEITRVGITNIGWRALKPNGDGWTVKGGKTRSGGGGGGGAGKTKDETGLSLGELFLKFASDEERKELEDASNLPADKAGNKTYAVKVAVKKRVIAEGLLQPKV